MTGLETNAARELTGSGLLRSADVLLMHTRRSPRAWLIRRSIHSYWNHALMIQVVPDPDQGPGRTLIIDPKMSGLTVDDVAYYLQKPELYDVGVKRFDREWFQDRRDSAGLTCRQRVLDLALKKVGENRASPNRWRSVVRFLRQVKLVFRPGREKKVGDNSPDGRPLDVTAYTCSGFVQWCYYRSVSQVAGMGGPDSSRLREVVFRPAPGSQEPTEYDLLSTTPGDLACSEALAWKYVIKDGVVWEVSSADEAQRVYEARGR